MNKTIIFLTLLIGSVLSCNRTLFLYENPETKSIEKIELRKEQLFSYSHKNEKGRLNARGRYKIKENKIILTFNPMDRKLEYLPVNEISVSIEKIGAYAGTKIEQLKIKDLHSGEEIIAGLIVKGYANGLAVVEAKTFFDGNFFFSTEHVIDEMELSCHQCCPVNFKLKESGIFKIALTVNMPLGIIGVGCGVYEGPSKEMIIEKEKDKIIELLSTDYDQKRYVLKEKK